MRSALIAIALLPLCSSSLRAVEIDSVIWGFDGKAVLDQFNPLSVLVSNPTTTAYEGQFVLRNTQGLGGERLGAKLVEPVYLSPNSSRWIQFFPYVKSEYTEWVIDDQADIRFSVPRPKTDTSAAILLTEPNRLSLRSSPAKRFPDDLFPASVTGTDGLKAVLVDHPPRWEHARRQAFLDWLSKGGVVHLLKGESGEFPSFPPALSVLNQPLERFRVGAGRVYRHNRTSSNLDKHFLENAVTLDFDTDENSAADADDAAVDEQVQNLRDRGNQYQLHDKFVNDVAGNVMARLRQMTNIEHHWAIIYLMSLVYIVLVFPGFFVLARRKIDYRAVYFALIGTVVVFSVGFHWVGRRGYGESTQINSLAIVRHLPDGALDVSGWSNLFATDGADYMIDHTGAGKIYSTCQEVEAVNGLINTGVQGQFVVDIPPFSSRSFAYRARVDAPESDVEENMPTVDFDVVEWDVGDHTSRIVLSAESDVVTTVKPHAIRALYRDSIYAGKWADGKLVIDLRGAQPLQAFFSRIENRYEGQYGFMNADDGKSREQRYESLQTLMIARSLNVNTPSDLDALSPSSDMLRLFIYAPMNGELGARLRFVDEPDETLPVVDSGYVLHVRDVFKPEKP